MDNWNDFVVAVAMDRIEMMVDMREAGVMVFGLESLSFSWRE